MKYDATKTETNKKNADAADTHTHTGKAKEGKGRSSDAPRSTTETANRQHAAQHATGIRWRQRAGRQTLDWNQFFQHSMQ